ncbi:MULTISPECIES: LCP family protein [Bacillales]|uniref:LCP family protein n=1 Tax=Lysinibacillus louembei TaxID=1470088 RepID=A0ABZ0S601_9BACI|nr:MULTISPECIES: LCP family protein [Bacillales]MCT6923957.1 LCP family protein [Metasolibacillus sp.]MCT6940495.1 LCP family protein [Metasolibacillus sp.]WPK13652.1 LCP family protein [Lysinibacillus louembei]
MQKRTKPKMQTWKKVVLYLIVLFIIGAASYGAYTYYSFQKAVEKMQKQDHPNNTEVAVSDKLPHIDPFSVLLLGIDEREHDTGRTDTMIVVTVNPEKKSVKMLSIPRDARVEIVGNNTVEKINHAYARGGIPMSIATVENILNIPIDYYIAVNMEGFLQIIDVLGGVTVNNDIDLSHQQYTFPKGEVTLDGEEALIFTRIRYEDPRGDFGRQLRQKQLIEAIAAKAASPSTLLKLNDIFDVLGDNVQMNFPMNNLYQLQKLYSNLNKDIDQLQFEKGDGQRIDTLWYYLFDEQELMDVSNNLQQHLAVE